MADAEDPARIQAPGLYRADGHDLPISQARPAIHDKLKAVLESPPPGPRHTLVKDRVAQFDRLFPIYPRPGTTETFFGATLMALFNVSPFLNFIQEASEKKAYNDPLMTGLYGLAQSFRGWRPGEEAEENQQESIKKWQQVVWNTISSPKADEPAPFKVGMMAVPEFIRYLFQRIENAESRQGQDGGDGVDLSIRFKQLFKYFFVRHTPMRCGCAQPVLRRQATGEAQPAGYILRVEVPKTMKLEEAISLAMWEKLARKRICPECGHKTKSVNDFDKLAYLPELLLINTDFIDKSGGRDNYRYPSWEKLTYPERLDMSALRNDPARAGDRANCVYKLQSVISCDGPRMVPGLGPPGSLMPGYLEYKAALRMNENDWSQFQYSGDPDSYAEETTFEEINKDGGVPHVLVYVRERHAEATVDLEPTGPQGGATEAVTPAASQPKAEAAHQDADPHDLERFLRAQDVVTPTMMTVYETAIAQLTHGRKGTEWMNYMFPGVEGAGVVFDIEDTRSFSPGPEPDGKYFDPGPQPDTIYVIKSLDEAKAFWSHPLLKGRYMELMEAVLRGGQKDLDALFGRPELTRTFLSSLTLFNLLSLHLNDREEHEFLQDVFVEFKESVHADSAFQFVRWLNNSGEKEGVAYILNFIGATGLLAGTGGGGNGTEETTSQNGLPSQSGHTPPGPQYYGPYDDNPWIDGTAFNNWTGTKAFEPANPGTNGDKNGLGTSADHEYARRIGSRLLSLANQKFSGDESDFDEDELAHRNELARRMGTAILGFGRPVGEALPPSTPETEARGLRLGKHLMWISKFGEDYPAIGGLTLDGSYDEPDDGYPDSGNPFGAVAIPTDPKDPRIEACQTWTLEELKREFRKEQLDWRGLRNDPEKHRRKFRKHFELERDYSIYSEGRLRQAIRDRGIRMRGGPKWTDRAEKAELVDALTDFDAQRLRGMQNDDGGESEDTESDRYESEAYQSSEASGTEAKYVAMERAAMAAQMRGHAAPAQPRVVAAAARTLKRRRGADGEDDDDDEIGALPPRKSPARARARY